MGVRTRTDAEYMELLTDSVLVLCRDVYGERESGAAVAHPTR